MSQLYQHTGYLCHMGTMLLLTRQLLSIDKFKELAVVSEWPELLTLNLCHECHNWILLFKLHVHGFHYWISEPRMRYFANILDYKSTWYRTHYLPRSDARDCALKWSLILRLLCVRARLWKTIRLANYSRTDLSTEEATASLRETESFGPFSSPVRGSQYHACTIQTNTLLAEE